MGIKENFEARFNRPKLIDFYNIFHQLHMLIQSGSTMQQSLMDIASLQEKVSLRLPLWINRAILPSNIQEMVHLR